MKATPHYEMTVIDGCQYSNWDRELFEELRTGGLSGVLATVVYWEDARQTLSLIGAWHQHFRNHADIIVPADSAEGIIRAKKEGKTAILLGLQNASPIEDELALVSVFRSLGICSMQLTYNNQSLLGSGAYEDIDSGITRYGRKAIEEMNRVGMIVDLSHSGDRTILEAIEISQRPVAITHANPKTWHPALRNMNDEVLKALAQNGGMLGFSLYPLHLKGGGACTLDEFCDMIAWTADQMGVEHVGIGSDSVRKWDYSCLEWMRSGRWTFAPDYGEGSPDMPSWPDPPDWFRSPADFPNIIKGLFDRGFSRQEVASVMGENWLNFFAASLHPA